MAERIKHYAIVFKLVLVHKKYTLDEVQKDMDFFFS